MADTPTLSISGLDELRGELGTAHLAELRTPLLTSRASYEPSLSVAGITFSISAAGEASISCFNSEDDKDPDGILAPKTKDVEETSMGLGPQLALTKDSAWMKYRVNARIRGTGGASLAAAKIALDGSKEAILGDYRRHRRDTTLRHALQQDLDGQGGPDGGGGFRAAVRREDLEKIRPGDALSYHVRGQLKANLVLRWSDVFSGNLSALRRFAGSSLVGLKVGAEAVARFNTSVADDFVVVFSDAGEGMLRVAVRKARSRERGLAAEVSIGVEFADPAEVETGLKTVLQGLVGDEVEAIDDALGRANTDQLSDRERQVIKGVASYLALDDELESLDQITVRWNALKDDVRQQIHALATSKVSAAFRYEYLRLQTEASLLQAVLPRETLQSRPALHEGLIKTDLMKLVAHVRASKDGSVLERYLHELTKTTKRTYGLTLGIGSVSIGGTDTDETTTVEQRNIEDGKRLSYGRVRGYAGKVGDDSFGWTVDFWADMKGFAATEPTLRDFEFGMRITSQVSLDGLSRSGLDKILDAARTWRIIHRIHEDEARRRLEPLIGTGVTSRLDIDVRPAAFLRLLPQLAGATDESFAVALAEAMPWWEQHPARCSMETREAAYRVLWSTYLSLPWLTLEEYARKAKALLKTQGLGTLADAECNHRTNVPHTFVQQIRTNSERGARYYGTAEVWQDFQNGMKELQAAFKDTASHVVIGAVYTRLRGLCTQALHVRALGALVMRLADRDPDVVRTFSVSDGEVVVVLATST